MGWLQAYFLRKEGVLPQYFGTDRRFKRKTMIDFISKSPYQNVEDIAKSKIITTSLHLRRK